jgi:drug/metabolite transporter (DMT)-like permease
MDHQQTITIELLQISKEIDKSELEEDLIPVIDIKTEPLKTASLTQKLKSQEGSFYAIMSALSISLSGIFYKKAGSMNGSDNSIFRYLIQLLTMICVLKYKKIPLLGPRDQRKLLLTRSFFGTVAVLSSNFAITFINPSDTVALSHTNIILIAVIARIFLKESLGLQHLMALLMTITGVMLITQPTFLFGTKPTNLSSNQTNFNHYKTNDRLIGVSFAIIGAFGSAAIHVIIKKLCNNKVYFGVTTLYGTFLGLPASILTSTVLVLIGADHVNFKNELDNLPLDFVFGLIGGGFAVFAHILFNISLQLDDATKVAIFRTIDVFFSFLFQFLMLNIGSNFISLVGALFIILATVIILLFQKKVF